MIISALLLAGQITTGQPIITVADSVPRLNIAASCRAAMKAVIGLTQTMDSCMQSENDARDQLTKVWSQAPAADRANCLTLTTTGTTGTYTELLTCIEMKQAARKLPKESGTVGAGER